jgi:hypothetical protein
MRYLSSALTAGILVVPLSLPAMADVAFTPSLALGHKKITFGAGAAGEVDSSMPTLGMGLATSYKRLTFQVNVEQSLQDGDYKEYTGPLLIQTVFPDNDVVARESYFGDVSRTDINFTTSISVTDRFAVFVGYIDNVTKISDMDIHFYDGAGDEYDVTIGDSPLQFGGAVDQKDSGAVAGIRFVPLITEYGSLSNTLGYAWLETETDVTIKVSTVGGALYDRTPTDTVDTTGLSTSLSWVGPIPDADDLRYLVTLRMNRFTQKEDAGDVDNDLTYFGAGLLYSL